MNVYDIAIGAKRTDRRATQYRWEWSEIAKRLKNVSYLEYSMETYKMLSRAQKVEVKDVGFFVGGVVDGRRTIYRQILSLDIDEPEKNTLKTLREWLAGRTYIIHSTCSSTPDNPRYRVVMPLNRVVQADEHGALLRILHETLNLPLDLATFDFNRIMFLPSIPKDATYFFEEKVGDPLVVEDVLKMNEDWRNLSSLKIDSVKVADPISKKGIVGAFCRKYTITEVLDTFLADKWRKEADGSYTLIGASTVSGGKIYEDKYLVSFHSSDVHLGKSHNAYDAVRLYKFGGNKEAEVKMLELCNSLGIRATDIGKIQNTLDEFTDEDAKKTLVDSLEFDKKGNLIKSLRNAELILQHDPQLSGVFGYDEFSEFVKLKRSPYWRTIKPVTNISEDCKNLPVYDDLEDLDESYLRLHFEEKYEYDAKTTLQDALNITSHKNSFHPIRDYLSSLVWDGEARLERIFIDCFGVKNTLYAREVGLKFFVGAVRRVFIPASKMDYIPVLVSEEGLGKSRFVRRMAKLWGSDTFYTFNGSKEAYEQLRGVWILEIPELNGVQNRGANNRKAFVTKGEDRYRSAYLKYTKTYKRQCVFIASSNDVVFLDDPSEDGRRWWGLLCDPYQVKIDVHSDDFLTLIDQYWAEAVHHYKLGVLPVLTETAEKEARLLRQIHKAESVEEGALIEYLNMPVPENWYAMSLFERRHYWNEEWATWHGRARSWICTTEVAREFFNIERSEMNGRKSKEIGAAIRATKMFIQDGTKKRFGEYGVSLAWVRIATAADIAKGIENELQTELESKENGENVN